MVKIPKENNTKVAVTLTKVMLEELHELAEKKGQTVSSILRLAAAEYIEHEKGK